jgi:hypothetical protein
MNGVTPYFLALFKAAYFSTKAFVVYRLPHADETYSGVQSSVLVKLTDIPLSSNNLILPTKTDSETK